jgi:signal peptidase I
MTAKRKIDIEPTQENTVYETIKTVFFAALIAMTLRSLIFEPFSIPSGSMVPTLLVGDYLFVSKNTYGYSRYSFPMGVMPIQGRIQAKPVERGDIIVFAKPHNERIDYIKRVIGLPGDHIQVKNGRLYINRVMVEREFVGEYEYNTADSGMIKHKRYKEILPEGREHMIIERSDRGPLDNTAEFIVPENHYFMMGDNRDGSQDSRVMTEVGFVPYENLVGRAERTFFSLEEGTPVWKIWEWPQAIRYKRLMEKII